MQNREKIRNDLTGKTEKDINITATALLVS
jgi:hypothetical protein